MTGKCHFGMPLPVLSLGDKFGVSKGGGSGDGGWDKGWWVGQGMVGGFTIRLKNHGCVGLGCRTALVGTG